MRYALLAVSIYTFSFTAPAVFAQAEAGRTDERVCSCAAIDETGSGWCRACRKGLVFGVGIRARSLYDVLAGEEIDPSHLDCKTCQENFKKGGHCKTCNIAFVNGIAYYSFISHTLAKARWVKPSELVCESCRDAVEAREPTPCTSCEIGYMGRLLFSDLELYESAKDVMTTLKAAAELPKHCEPCALRMVSDPNCPGCKLKLPGDEEVEVIKVPDF